MSEEERWNKVRQIVREECERIELRILEVLDKHTKKAKVSFENGRWTGVTPEQLEAWKAAYGAVDIESELKKAAAWIVSNPHLAPKSQHGRFLNTWLARQQNQSSLRSIPSGKSEAGPGKKLCSYCENVATGSVGHLWHCPQHLRDAMDGKPRSLMLGVVPKAVAGSD
jgi:hypothetical protein